jgi:hypothetical protein|tara:strand:+ start:153 stop:953 length:801 start_codon:yes stop_codon:yes gene_type:complete
MSIKRITISKPKQFCGGFNTKRKNIMEDKTSKVIPFEIVTWSERFATASNDIGGLANELKIAMPNFKTDRVSDEYVKDSFNLMKFTFSNVALTKNPKGLKTNTGKIGYWLLNNGKWSKVTEVEFNKIATDDTRLKGTSLNLSNDSYGAIMYATKPAFRTHLKNKAPAMYEDCITTIDWLTQSIRSKVRVLDVALDTDSNAPKSARRSFSKSVSMLENLDRWEGKDGNGLQKAIDNGDALGLAWVEFRPKYKEFKAFFKAVVKRENG